jgi:hypothetical protein
MIIMLVVGVAVLDSHWAAQQPQVDLAVAALVVQEALQLPELPIPVVVVAVVDIPTVELSMEQGEQAVLA